MKRFIMMVLLVSFGALFTSTASMGSEISLRDPINIEKDEETGTGELMKVILNNDSVIYVSPTLRDQLDQDRIEKYAGASSGNEGKNVPPLIVTELTEEDIDEHSQENKWADSTEEVETALKHKFSEYLPEDDTNVFIIVQRDSGDYELYKHSENKEGSYMVVSMEIASLDKSDTVNTPVEVFMDEYSSKPDWETWSYWGFLITVLTPLFCYVIYGIAHIVLHGID